MKTLFDEIQKDLKVLLSDKKYTDFIQSKEIDPKIFSDLFNALLNTRTILDENEDKLDDAKISMMNTIKNTFLNIEK